MSDVQRNETGAAAENRPRLRWLSGRGTLRVGGSGEDDGDKVPEGEAFHDSSSPRAWCKPRSGARIANCLGNSISHLHDADGIT